MITLSKKPDDIMSYRIEPGAALDAETRRIAAEQLEKAAAELSSASTDEARHEAVHDVRKRLKKLRALLRLVRPGNGRVYRAENARLRDAARALSAVRDRTALIESLDALAPHIPVTLAEKSVRPALAAVREGLEARRRDAVAAEGDLSGKIDATLVVLGAAREAIDAIAFPKPLKGAADIAATGYALTYARARDALKACKPSGGTPEHRHELRRHVKYLGFHLALLAPLWPEALAPMRAAASMIADDLGLDHDYALLDAELAAEGEDALASPAHCALVGALIAARQAELQSAALASAARLLAEKLKAARNRFRSLYALAAKAAAIAEPAPDVLAAAAE